MSFKKWINLALLLAVAFLLQSIRLIIPMVPGPLNMFLIGSLLNMKVAPGNSSIFVGNKEFEIMKKPGRGTNGHIAIGCNNVDRAIYHLSQRGVKFDLDSKNVKNGKTVACYMADEIAGFAFHLVQR